MGHALMNGIRVIEIAGPLAEHAGRALAELGAEVLLIEPPEGSPTRLRRPYHAGSDRSRRSIPFIARNAGKRSVVLDPGSVADRALFERLVGASDALLSSSDSTWLSAQPAQGGCVRVVVDDSMGLGPSALVPFAASGGLSSSGWPHQPPCNAPSWLALDAAGVYAAGLVALGLWMVRRGLDAPRFSVPLHEAALAGITPWTRPLLSYELTTAGQGMTPGRTGAGTHPVYECLDGYVRVLTVTPRQWEAWVELLGRPEALTADEWKNSRFRAQNQDALYHLCQEETRKRRRDDLFHAGQRMGVTITPVLSPAEFLHDPHVAERSFLAAIEDPDVGSVRLPSASYRCGPQAARPRLRPAPALGEFNAQAERLAAPPSRTSPGQTEAAPVDAARPLAGMRVLELGVGAVIPELASQLALLGAEVIKVESLRYLDFLRRSGAGRPGEHNGSVTFNQLNLGVLSCAVDMTTAEGCALVLRLAARSDVVLENMRAPVVRKWGLDYESVRAVKPDIVYLSSQGFGEGPYGGYQTYGPNLQSFSCVTALWAHPDDPFPVGTTLNHPDHLAGKQALIPLLAAIMRRDETGEGTYIDAAQFEFAASLLSDKLLQEQLAPGSVTPLGNRSLDFAPHGVYPCQGVDEWCALAVCDEAAWRRLQGLIAAAALRDERFASLEGRLQHVDALDALIAAWTSGCPAAEVEALLRAHGIAASRVATAFDFAARTEAHHDGLFTAVPHPLVGTRWYTGLPFTYEDDRRYAVRRPPLLGEHTEHVLHDVLGLSGAEVSRLADAGIVGY